MPRCRISVDRSWIMECVDPRTDGWTYPFIGVVAYDSWNNVHDCAGISSIPRRAQTPINDRYQSPDPRRSYRPSTVTRKSVIAIAAAAAAVQTQASTASSQRVTASAAAPVDLSASPPKSDKNVSCC